MGGGWYKLSSEVLMVAKIAQKCEVVRNGVICQGRGVVRYACAPMRVRKRNKPCVYSKARACGAWACGERDHWGKPNKISLRLSLAVFAKNGYTVYLSCILIVNIYTDTCYYLVFTLQ